MTDARIQTLEAAVLRTPNEPVARNRLALALIDQRRYSEARSHLEAACALDPGQPGLLINLAAATRGTGDVRAAIAVLDAALAVDPYLVQALFQRAAWLHEAGEMREAARHFRNFLKTAPAEILDDPRFASPIAQARAAIAADDASLDHAIAQHADAPSPRTRLAFDMLLGKAKRYVSEPTFLSIPHLPAVPFLDRDATPWIAALEAQTDAIAAEARLALNSTDAGQFEPYVANPAGTPLNQWQDLDHNPRWGAFFFWKHGRRFDKSCSGLSATATALQTLPLLELEGRAPNAFYSKLEPHTQIPPHTGVTNARLTVHLPLVVPPRCGFRVGNDVREWRVGEAWVFDDTIEHEAWNDSDEDRVILIFDIWHPMLDRSEREYITQALAAYDAHYGLAGLTDTL
jgi:aspartate beta-hydroxylase